jgi:hypothetical protein
MAGARASTCALAISRWSTLTTLRETGCAEVNASLLVATTAPGTRWFTYVTFVTRVLLITVVR